MKSINLSSIDLNLLVAFEALYEERSVTAAAQRLYLGQPAMSAALGRLRSLFADELFIRMGREMQPTSKAVEIAPAILAVLQQIRQTLESSRTFDPATTPHSFTIGSSDYTSFVVVPRLLTLCQQIAPQVNLRLVSFEKDTLEEQLQQGEMDLALGVFPNSLKQTCHDVLFQERFVGIAQKGHAAIANNCLSLDTFAALSHALVTLRRDETGFIDQVLSTHQLTRRITVTTPHVLLLPFLVASSGLVASVPSRILHQVGCRESLQSFPLPIATEPWNVSMIWSKLVEQDSANVWLRQTLRLACATL